MSDSWYPTIYFYDIESNQVVWEIFGAEQFININKDGVTLLTNEIWNKLTGEKYKELV